MSSQQEDLEQAMRDNDFERFQALRPNIDEASTDHELMYLVLTRGHPQFWDWYMQRNYNHLIEEGLYAHRDIQLGSSRPTSMANYFLKASPEERDYRYMYQLYEAARDSLDVHNLMIMDPLLVEIALDVAPENYSTEDVQVVLEWLDDQPPSDALEEVYEVLENWLEQHNFIRST